MPGHEQWPRQKVEKCATHLQDMLLRAQLVQGGVTNRESMREAMEGTDVVIQNEAWYEFGITKQAPATMYATNVGGTAHLRQAVAK